MGRGSQESRAEGRSTVKCLGDWDITLRAMRKFLWLELGHSRSRRSSSWGALRVQWDLYATVKGCQSKA